MNKTIVAACISIGSICVAGDAANGGVVTTTTANYCPNPAGNLAPFCVDGCSNISPCAKKCRSDDAAATCITCEEWGQWACISDDPPPPPPPGDTTGDFHGTAVINRTNGCTETVNAHQQTLGGNSFQVIVDIGPCDLGPDLRNLKINTRVTPDGKFRILFPAPSSAGAPAAPSWGDITIDPWDQGIKAVFAAAYPARGITPHDVFFRIVNAVVEILFLDPAP